MTKKLRDYQIAHLAFHMARDRSGDLSDPGVGKTAPLCVYMAWLWSEHREKTIWTMPKSLMKKNRDELIFWSEGMLDPQEIIIVDGTAKKRQKAMETNGKVFIMGFDCFANNWPTLIELHPEINCLVGDEWHMGFKGAKSKRTQSFLQFMDHCEKLKAMSGTIIDGRLDAAYAFIKACMPEKYRSYEHFMGRHAIDDGYGRVVAWRNVHEVAEIFKQIGVRHTFEQAYGPEAKVIVVEQCQMDPKQREAYDEFEETALLELEESWLDGTLPGVNLIRCRQLMEHPQTFGEPLDKIARTGKEEALLVHLEDHKNTGKPLVIFSALTPQHDRVADMCRKMGFKVGIIDGRISAPQRAKVDEAFRAGELDIVIASPATAGVGYNWPHVDHILFMSLDYMDSNFVQAYRRAIRGKRTSPLLITVLEYENSVDQKIFEIIEKKSKLAQDVDDSRERLQLRKKRQKEVKQAPDTEKYFRKPTLSNV